MHFNILDDLERKPNNLWVDQGSKLYNKSFKKWLDDNDTKMYLKHNKGKSIIVERFIRTLKHKIYKHMTVVSKKVYVDVLDNIFDK